VTPTCMLLHIFVKFTIIFLLLVFHFFN
jgi:hypothetical protein